MAHGLEAIDWSAPWLAHLREKGEFAAQQAHIDTPLHETLNHSLTSPVRFVSQSSLPSGMAYEQFIFDTRQCPTRDGLHDFFNALYWDLFPLTKSRLNQLQAEQIMLLGSQNSAPQRGAVRDALTVFDENGALLIAPPSLWEALLAMDWQRLFVTLRPLWQQARLIPFGHALLEKLVHPRKPITAHVYIASFATENIAKKATNTPAISHFYSILDDWFAADLSAEKLATKPFAPLPILGIPDWWAANEEPAFYKDDAVFRRPR